MNMGLFTLLEIGFHVPVDTETISIVKGCHVTAALLFAKENQKTLKCPRKEVQSGARDWVASSSEVEGGSVLKGASPWALQR